MRIITSAVVFFIVGYGTFSFGGNLKMPIQNADVDNKITHCECSHDPLATASMPPLFLLRSMACLGTFWRSVPAIPARFWPHYDCYNFVEDS